MTEDKVTIEISRQLYDDIEKHISGTGFRSVEDFVRYTLSVAIGKSKDTVEACDEAAQTERLRALGYL
ncbi:MAG: hypothetical protein ABSB26_04680 [Nitrososphaerales archaeon]|jgi:Arc/MetJ-type ribon-helix-helix transcriptional regulator